MTGARVLVSVLCGCVALVVSTPSVVAGKSEQGKTAFDEGQRQFLAGNYREALASFKKGFLVTDDAAFLLNAAQCHRFLGERDEALMMYRMYLKSTPQSANREAREVAAKAIHELENESAVAPVAPAKPPRAAVGSAVSPEVGSRHKFDKPPASMPVLAPLPEMEAKQAALPPPPPKPSDAPEVTARRLRLAGLVCGGVGLVSLGIGFYYWTSAVSLSDSANTAAVYNQADYDGGKRAETMQWVFYSIGTAAVVTGAALYAYGRWRPAAKKSSVSLAPMVGLGAAGLEAHGAF